MKHTTTNKKWLKALIFDSALIGGMTYALMTENTTIQTVLVFFMWWLVCLRAVAYLLMFFMGIGRDMEPKYRKTWNKFWTPMASKLAASETFLFYRVVTNIWLISLLVGNGYFWLAFLWTANFICSLVLIQHARAKVEAEHNGQKSISA